MIVVVFLLIVVAIFYAPQWWVNYVFKKHSRELEGMPGTGGELAKHLLEKFELSDVTVEECEPRSDHYSPSDNAVRLSPDNFNGKSLTAIAIAAHEVGHAIQFNRKEPVSYLRSRYMSSAIRIKRVAIAIFMIMPLVTAVFHVPQLSLATIGAGLVAFFISIMMYVAILPEEFDASFNKALPILDKGDYVPKTYLPAIEEILKAAAFTYVAGALADVLRLWRWIRFLR
ncbi:MAG: Zn-dependent membrane protease YugP [Flavobacteriales bacterium]|jgi:Zn-dependent membrane protease YugP